MKDKELKVVFTDYVEVGIKVKAMEIKPEELVKYEPYTNNLRGKIEKCLK